MTPASSRCAALCSAPAALCSRGLLALTGAAAQDPAFEQSFSENTEMQFPGAEDGAGGKPDDKQKKVGLSDVYNVDSKVLRGLQKYNEQTDQADFLFAAEQGGKNHRPWGEKMTFYTGCGVLCGGTMGAVYGAYDGIKNAKGSSQRIVINSVANQVGMWGTKASNKLGVAALMYSTLGWLSTYAREEDDHINSVCVAAATGAILSTGVPQTRAIAAATTMGGLSFVNYLDVWNRVRTQRTYARRGNRFNRHSN